MKAVALGESVWPKERRRDVQAFEEMKEESAGRDAVGIVIAKDADLFVVCDRLGDPQGRPIHVLHRGQRRESF